MAQWEDRKVRISGQPRPLTPLMEDLLTKVQGEAREMAAAAATFASDNYKDENNYV